VACSPQKSLAPLVAQLQPSVVNIYTTKLQAHHHPLAPFFSVPPQVTKERSLGSGFIYNATEGLVVTNAHVVAQAQEIKVRLSDRRELRATLLGGDPEIDLALLRVQRQPGTNHKLHQVQVGDSDQLRVGDWVLAIGNPFGLSQTVTLGIVSALSRTIGAGPFDDFIQTDASINPGNSGGPLFDMQGRVVGINTAIHREGQGIGFAIPMTMAQPLLDQIRTDGRVTRVHLGVVIQDVTPQVAQALGQAQPQGALVASVISGSPASAAGIQPGDVIVQFNNHDIEYSRSLPTQVARTRSGQQVPVTVLRARQRLNLTATMVNRPPSQYAPPQGAPPGWPQRGGPGFGPQGRPWQR
jgi:serine protease Do